MDPRRGKATGSPPAEETEAAAEEEEATIAFRKKKARRVSFAETTAVHVFLRDEDFETPPEARDAQNPPLGDGTGQQIELPERVGDGLVEDGGDYTPRRPVDEGEEDDGPVLFVRNVDLSASPSSGAGSLMSGMSNEDEDYYGPVSASFLRYGRGSETGSESNHDITMDSTAFSMHFHSLVPSDVASIHSEGFKTPTGYKRTPTHDPDDMTMSGFKKPFRISPFPKGEQLSNGDTDRMSPVEEGTLKKYDYGQLSPNLASLLAEARKDIKDFVNCGQSDGLNVSDSSSAGVNLFKPNEVKGNFTHQNDLSDEEMDDVMDFSVAASYEQIEHDHHLPIMRETPLSDTHVSNYKQLVGGPASGMISDISKESINVFPDVTKSKLESDGDHNSGLIADQMFPLPSEQIKPSSHINQVQFSRNTVLSPQNESKFGDFDMHPSSLAIIMEMGDGRMGGISNFEILETPEVGISKSRSALSEHSHTPTVLEATQGKNVDGITSSVLETPKNLIISRQVELDGDSRSRMSRGLVHDDQIYKLREESIFRQFSGSVKNIEQTMTSQSPLEGAYRASTVCRSEFPQRQTVSEFKENKQVSGTPNVLSPVRELGHKLLRSPLYTLDHSRHLDLDTSLKKVQVVKDLTLSSNMSHISPLSEIPKESTSLHDGPMNCVSSNKKRQYDNGKELVTKKFHGLQVDMDSNEAFQTPLNDTTIPAFHSSSHGRKLRNKMDADSLEKMSGELKYFYKSASSNVYKDRATTEQHEQSMVKSLVQRSYKKEASEGLGGCDVPPLVQNDMSSLTSINGPMILDNGKNHQPLSTLQAPLSTQDIASFGERMKVVKNSKHDVTVMNNQEVNHVEQNQRSSTFTLQKEETISKSSPGQHEDCKNATSDLECGASPKNLTDVTSKKSADTRQLCPPSFDDLNSLELGVLENIVEGLQKARKVKRLCSDICSQEQNGSLARRVAEVRLVRDAQFHKQEKLKLMRVKRDKFLRTIEQLQSGIQKCLNLKSSSMRHLCKPTGDAGHKEGSVNQAKGAPSKVNPVKHERVAIEQKVNDLTKSLSISCKLTEQCSSDEIIATACSILEKRTCCRLIQQDLQLWELEDIDSRNGQHTILLNYKNLLFQRFTVNVGSVSSIVVSNLLNDENINKKFPNTGAHTAFEFVFNIDDGHRLSGSKSYRQQTFVTSQLFGNLLYVLNEVRVTRLEVPNLVCMNFHSPCDGQLELQLSFINFRSSQKVTLFLNMTDLNCAIYPTEILPSKLRFMDSTPPSVITDITGVVRNLAPGYLMITRISQCISRIVGAWSG